VLTAIALVRRAFHVPPEAISAAVGPGIGRCCYEVDDASAEPFLSQFGAHPGVYRPSRPGHRYLDLQQAIGLQLSAAGVPSTQTWFADLCTACHPQWFYSYRREGIRSGRMLNVVMIQAQAVPTPHFPLTRAPAPDVEAFSPDPRRRS
jgi:copper oxidase (laccase) domain-containing protein